MTYKILVIDDHPETLSIIQNVLEQHGYDVSTAQSGIRGLSLAESERPDLVMLDGMMPEIDGWEVCRRMRSNENLRHIPIIMFSAVEEAEQKLAGFDAGADDYLTKPTEPEELIERVQILLQSVLERKEKATEGTQIVAAAKTEHMPQQPPTSLTQTTFAAAGSLIVVLGARGGVGTTTMAINLAAALADQGVFTTLVDMDVRQGHVAHYLKQKPGARKMTADLSADDLNIPVNYRENFQLLLTSANWTTNREDTAVVQQLLQDVITLKRPEHAIVVDAGRAVTAANQPILAHADQIIVCLRPERVALAAARQLFIYWRHSPFAQTPLHPVMFDFLGSREIPQEAIEGYLGQALTLIIPVQMPQFIAASNKGIPLIELHRDSDLATLFGQLAQKIVKT